MRKLFLDLDGVLADFDRGVRLVTGKTPEELSAAEMWRALARAPDFFGTLAMMRDAQVLWEFCKPHAPTILTGLPRGDWAQAQKRRWVAKHLGSEVPVITCLSHEKARWSGPGHVLVDGRAHLREAWVRAGGVFIHHVNAARSIAQLKELGFEAKAPAESSE